MIMNETQTEIHAKLTQDIQNNDIVVFMKGTPQSPMCGFSGQVVQIFQHLGVPFKGINVLDDAEVRQGIKDLSNWPTIPQVYIKGEFIGGCDIMREMFQSGELAAHLDAAGLSIKSKA
jgi:monothiol glutaredoxin